MKTLELSWGIYGRGELADLLWILLQLITEYAS
jgi:hypothetical protein